MKKDIDLDRISDETWGKSSDLIGKDSDIV